MEIFGPYIVRGAVGNELLFRRLVLLLEGDVSKNTALRGKVVDVCVCVCENWNRF
jgi:hypothetical protein